uniref:Venom protein n=1 Tax=Ampulex compressa TaxID=860918 RepID=A0A1W6EW21_AMPCP|nr:venom protein [Ampulex compressa]
MPIMPYINFSTVTIFLYLLMTVQSQVMTWLMLGEMFQKEEVSIETDLMSEELFFPVSKTEFFEVKTNEERIITSVIAASIHMQGYVTVLSGGINHTKVEVLYASKYSFPDILYIYIQSARQFPNSVNENAAKTSIQTSFYVPKRPWTMSEMRAAFLHKKS